MDVLRNNLDWGNPSEQHSLADYNKLAEAREAARELRRRKAEQAERALFEQVAIDRSETAFSELYDRFAPRVYAMLLHMLRVEEDARDLLQEIFILIWDKAPAFYTLQMKPAAWIMQLARNRAIDEVRSKRYRGDKKHMTRMTVAEDQPELDLLVEDYHTPDGDLAAKEARGEIRRALRELTPDQRNLVDMIYFGGMRYTEVAERLNIPVGTVKTNLRRSVMKLGSILKPRM